MISNQNHILCNFKSQNQNHAWHNYILYCKPIFNLKAHTLDHYFIFLIIEELVCTKVDVTYTLFLV